MSAFCVKSPRLNDYSVLLCTLGMFLCVFFGELLKNVEKLLFYWTAMAESGELRPDVVYRFKLHQNVVILVQRIHFQMKYMLLCSLICEQI